MYNKIYVFSPTINATGGTELLQQLVYKLRAMGQEAYMFYTATYTGSKVENVFGPRYSNPYVDKIEDDKDNIIIVSEAEIFYLLDYKNVQKAVWWLSVDFYGGSFRLPSNTTHRIFYSLSDMIYKQYDKEWIHLVQSEYAYNYCVDERNIPSDRVFRLSDYLSSTFILNADKCDDSIRKNQVLYNPKKGYVFAKSLIDSNPDIKWIPIVNMTSDQIVNLMKESKVYIDFGNHPGKDRIPREAAICGCCIITGKKGSAFNNIDIPIPISYKFEESESEQIIAQIKTIFEQYESCKKDFQKYVEKIKREELVFEDEIKLLFIKDHAKINVSHSSVIYFFKLRVLRNLAFAMKFLPGKFGLK